MKFLVQNYASEHSTQAMYLARGLNTDGHTAVLWNNNCSLYDIMDKEKPNCYITTASMLSKDFLHYAENHLMFDMKLILNVDGISQDIINSLETSLINNNIKCLFFFSTNPNIKTKKIRFVNLNNSYDSYLSQKSQIQYSISKGVIVNSREEIEVYSGSYHILSNSKDLNGIADIVLPESQMCSLYHNYDEIVVNINDVIPQVFFDALMYGNKVYYRSKNEDVKKSIEKLLRTDENLDYADENRTNDFEKIKKTVLERHSSHNRIKTLLSQLPKE
jgi:hypothetical protein